LSLHSGDTLDSDPREPRTVALLSDVHGNLPAFKAVLADIAGSGADETWCLGDLVGYGAQPDECVTLATEECDLCLVGNHDLVVLGKLDIADFSENAAIAAGWTRDKISAQSIAFLSGLASQDLARAIGLYHASPRDPVWEYVVSDTLADICIDAMPSRVSAVGHSHLALYFGRAERDVTGGAIAPEGTEIDLSCGRWLINPGAVGQPRDGDPRAAWLLLSLERWTATWRRVDYPIDEAASAIEDAGLPKALADRLRYGR